MARSDLHWTDFIEVDKEDIFAFNNIEDKGFKTIGVNGDVVAGTLFT